MWLFVVGLVGDVMKCKYFVFSRKEDRRQCLDLQNFVIHLPEGVRQKLNRPSPAPSHYPVALVPGQFQDFYKEYSPAELM